MTALLRIDRTRRASLALVLWAFGLATTTLLIGLWGRTVTSDESTLHDTAEAAITAELATDRITSWVAGVVGATTDTVNPQIAAAVDRVTATPEYQRAIDRVVADLVVAALADAGTTPHLPIASALEPMVPVIVDELAAGGITVPPEQVEAAVSRAADVILDDAESTSVTGVASRARSLLTTVLVVGLATLLLFGSVAIALAEEPLAMVRSLATRLAVSAATFAVVLRVGAWAMDPGKGRSPLPRSGAVLLASNHLVLFLVAGAGVAIAVASGVVISGRRRRAA